MVFAFLVSLAALVLLIVAVSTSKGGWGSVISAFTPDGWNRMIAHITDNGSWDRWLVIIAFGLYFLFTVILSIILVNKLTTKRYLGVLNPIFSFLFLLVPYIYCAWPVNGFNSWQRIFVYVYICSGALCQLVYIIDNERYVAALERRK